ncbi:MAG: alpha/beta fold hydrolase [Myxococcales bacterium]|nr:alpha/beta fold hydrolase [Myxococcales bacterium]
MHSPTVRTHAAHGHPPTRLWLAALTLAAPIAACGDDGGDDGADTSGAADVAADSGAGGGADAAADASDAAGDVGDDASADAGADTDTAPGWPAEPDRTPLAGGGRPSDVLVPADYTTDREWPLVVLLHGFGASGLLQRAYLQLPAQVDAQGFILLSPDGTTTPRGQQFWNAWDACCDFGGTEVDDVGYLLGLVDEAEARYRIDAKRVYFIGHSNGGFMSFRMACEAPDRVAAIMSLAGSMPSEPDRCVPGAPVSVLSVHGTDDDTVPYDSSDMGPGAVASLAPWTGLASCDETPVVEAGPDYTIGDDGTTVSRWGGCDPGLDVELWTLDGTGHLPPFNADFAPAMIAWLLSHQLATP